MCAAYYFRKQHFTSILSQSVGIPHDNRACIADIFSSVRPNFELNQNVPFAYLIVVFCLTLNLSFSWELFDTLFITIYLNYKAVHVVNVRYAIHMCAIKCAIRIQNTQNIHNVSKTTKTQKHLQTYKTFRMEKCDQIRIVLDSCFYLSKQQQTFRHSFCFQSLIRFLSFSVHVVHGIRLYILYVYFCDCKVYAQ